MEGYSFETGGRTIFFAGGARMENWHRAEAFCQDNDRIRIADTEPGRIVDGFSRRRLLEEYFGRKDEGKIWDYLSQEYAMAADGEVVTFVSDARRHSIFRRMEMPALLNNPKVTNINGVPREELKDFMDDKILELRSAGLKKAKAIRVAENEVYRAIVLSEITRDLELARECGNDELKADVYDRFAAHKRLWRGEDKAKTYLDGEGGGYQARADIDFQKLKALKSDILVDVEALHKWHKETPEDVGHHQGHWSSEVDYDA